MALIHYSPLINQIRGSIGNASFQRSLAGNIVRSKPVPPVKNSQQIVNVRTVLPQIVFAWRNLSDADKITWRNYLTYSPDYMRKNPKMVLSAYSLFVKYNTIRVLVGFSVLSSFIFVQPSLSPTRPLPYIDSGNLWMDIGQSIPGVDWGYMIRMSRPCTSVHNRALNDLRIVVAFNGPNQLFNINSEYLTTWGIQPVAGNILKCELKFFSSSMPFVYSPIVHTGAI